MRPFLVSDDTFARLHGGLRLPNGQLDTRSLGRLAALYRVNALAALCAARHGWLGASFSCTEILTAVYHGFLPDPTAPVADRAAFVLSKGHAAAGHYAVLAGFGAFPVAALLDYKAPGGLPAHSDRGVRGVDTDSGSLGQGLSKAIGLALARGGRHPTFALLGDGELQEGQVFEALLTLARHRPPRTVVIVDRNGLQTDRRTAEVKDAASWPDVVRGVGLPVFAVDGHDIAALLEVLGTAVAAGPAVVIAETVKGEGTALTRMPAARTASREAVWHGRIPDDAEYDAMLDELVAAAGDADVAAALAAYRAATDREAPAARAGSLPGRSTADAFGQALLVAAERHPELTVLDADLEKSCRLQDFALRYPERTLEVGISEQDMVSIAAGLALGGRLAVVNTYAAFYKRAVDQLAGCAAERLPVLFVGHYAGLDYTTDGKSHQALEDVGILRALGGFEIVEPLTPEETEGALAYLLGRLAADLAAGRRSHPAYLRLHRSAADTPLALPGPFVPGRPYRLPPHAPSPLVRLFAASPHVLALALAVREDLERTGLVTEVVAVSSYYDRDGSLTALLDGPVLAVALESHRPVGGLADLLAERAVCGVLRIGAEEPCGSTRTLGETFLRQGLTVESIGGRIRRVLGVY